MPSLAIELSPLFAGLYVPHAYGLIATPGDKLSSIRCEGHFPDAFVHTVAFADALMTDKALQFLSSSEVDPMQDAVQAADRHGFAVGCEREAVFLLIEREAAQGLARAHIPESQTSSRRRGEGSTIGRNGEPPDLRF